MATPDQPDLETRKWIRVAGILFVHFLTLLMLIAVFVRAVPYYEHAFAAHQIRLPTPAIEIINCYHIVLSCWPIIFLATMLVDVAVIFMLTHYRSSTSLLLGAWAHFWTLFCVFLLTLAFSVLSTVIERIPN